MARRRTARGELAVRRTVIALLEGLHDTVAANLSQVAHEDEVVVATVVRVAGRHEVPVGLKDERTGLAVAAGDRSGDPSTRAEARIQAAVRVVADDGEGVAAPLVRVP